MDKRALFGILLSLLLALVAIGIVGAQTSTSFDLSWFVLAGGGSRADGASHALNGTLGQGTVGLSDSPSFQMHSGYWYGASLPRYRIYLPLVLLNYP